MKNETNVPNDSNNKRSFKISAIIRWIVGCLFVLFALVNGFHFSSLFLVIAAFLMFPLPFVENFLKENNVKSIVVVIVAVVLFFFGVVTAPAEDTPEGGLVENDTSKVEVEDSNLKNDNDIETAKPSGGSTSQSGTSSGNSGSTSQSGTSSGNSGSTSQSGTSSGNSGSTSQSGTSAGNSGSTSQSGTSAGNSGSTSQSGTSSGNSGSTTHNDEKTKMVWIPSSGSKYHSNPSCSNMKSPKQVTLEEAEKQDYEPCKRCH